MAQTELKQMWAHILQERRARTAALDHRLAVKSEYLRSTAAFTAVLPRIEANIDTHQAIYIDQKENGVITVLELLSRLESEYELTVDGMQPDQTLSTSDKGCGICTAVLSCGGVPYEIVFTDQEIYAEYSRRFAELGGILNGDVQITEDVEWKANALVTGTVTVQKGATLTVKDGSVLTVGGLELSGSVKAGLIGNVHLRDGAVLYGYIYDGNIRAEGVAQLSGMHCVSETEIMENATLRLYGGGMLVNTLCFGDGSTLEMFGAEPITCGFDYDHWYVDPDHKSEEKEHSREWHMAFKKTLTDVLGRSWMCELKGEGLPRPDLGTAKDKTGIAVVGENVSLKGIGDAPNVCVILGDRDFKQVTGYVALHTVDGMYCSPKDAARMTVGEIVGSGTEQDPYILTYHRQDPELPFEMDEGLVINGVTSKVVQNHFKGYAWRSDKVDGQYMWYAYRSFSDCEHWHGRNGKELFTVYLREI